MDSKYSLPAAALVALIAAALMFMKSRRAKVLLDKQKKVVQIVNIVSVSHDVKRFTLSLGGKTTILGLPIGKHLSICFPNAEKCVQGETWNGKPDPDNQKRLIDRKYTPVTGDDTPGYVDLVVKIYRAGTFTLPNGKEHTFEDGGKCSRYLDEKKIGDKIEINGPFGLIEYMGNGHFKVPGGVRQVGRVAMMAGGSGITPMLQVVTAALRDPEDECRFSLIYANKTEGDILCRDLLEDAVTEGKGRFQVFYTLDMPPVSWKGKSGFITTEMIQECLPGPELNPLVLLCGPPPMVEFACKRNLEKLGYDKKYVQRDRKSVV